LDGGAHPEPARYPVMGTVAQVWSEPPPDFDAGAVLSEIEARLSRFDPASELSRLNGDPRASVPASPLLRAAVRAALWAAERTGGLVDPTLLAAVQDAGYDRSRSQAAPAPLAQALAAAPPRRPAHPARPARWRQVHVDDDAVLRPPGLALDLAGTAKGWTADLVADRLAGRRRFVVDCGGDLRVADRTGTPWPVRVRHPLTGDVADVLPVTEGGVATSGIDARLWTRADGSPAHHLLDPATGTPAWTGLVSATALAPTALEAEALAKAAYLSGPRRARRLLARAGGVLVHESGRVEAVGPAHAGPDRPRRHRWRRRDG
jgi:thiamine biosynthesis lipoprotein